MAEKPSRERRRGPVALTELVGKILDPVTARRGFAKAELLAAWPGIAGPAFAEWTAPEKIVWPRARVEDGDTPGILVLRVDGPRAIYVQHELPQIIERVNAFLGYRAVGQVRIVQGPVRPRKAPQAATPLPPLGPDSQAALDKALATVADDGLRAALDRLGRGVLGSRKRD